MTKDSADPFCLTTGGTSSPCPPKPYMSTCAQVCIMQNKNYYCNFHSTESALCNCYVNIAAVNDLCYDKVHILPVER